jgi:GNAT superfamily N-acetyltransferase
MSAKPTLKFHTLAERPDLRGEIIRIFFESSRIQSFESEAAKNAFQDKWLNAYIDDMPEQAIVAVTDDGKVAGYLTGCFNSAAAKRTQHQMEFNKENVEALYREYPAHLHINIDASMRGAGAGARLIEEFARRCRAEGVSGIHLVTAKGARNVRFYERNGFSEVISRSWKGAELLVLGRKL